MEKQLMSYEEFKQFHIDVDPNLAEKLQELHGIDIDKELDKVMRQEYDFYLERNVEK